MKKEECYKSRNNTLFLSSSPPPGPQPDCLGQPPGYWDKGFLLWPKPRKRARCLTQADLFQQEQKLKIRGIILTESPEREEKSPSVANAILAPCLSHRGNVLTVYLSG